MFQFREEVKCKQLEGVLRKDEELGKMGKSVGDSGTRKNRLDPRISGGQRSGGITLWKVFVGTCQYQWELSTVPWGKTGDEKMNSRAKRTKDQELRR